MRKILMNFSILGVFWYFGILGVFCTLMLKISKIRSQVDLKDAGSIAERGGVCIALFMRWEGG